MFSMMLCVISLWSTCAAFIGHECGIAMVRLRKPLEYYQTKYSSHSWGLRSLCLLMEEQRNRGQDGAGIAVVNFDTPPGKKYMHRIRFTGNSAIEQVFNHVFKDFGQHENLDAAPPQFLGEVYIGHVRYGTFGRNEVENCQPYLFKNNVSSKQFALAGNFNMTNSNELFDDLVNHGLTLTSSTDTQVILEHIRYRIDQEHDYLATKIPYKLTRLPNSQELSEKISQQLNLTRVLTAASRNWDGGYVFGGIIGNGDMFICRDPAGIRPGFYYLNDELFAAASERAALYSVFHCEPEDIQEIPPGHVIVIKRDGTIAINQFTAPLELRQCSFERIYFSRPHDPDIYTERKQLGAQLAQRVLDLVDWHIENVVFTYIPNSSDASFEGLTQEIKRLLDESAAEEIWKKIEQQNISQEDVYTLCTNQVHAHRLIYKNQKLRTFITEGGSRSEVIARLYDTTKGIVKPTDTLVAVDDSIVRGATLRESIIPQLIRLNPKNIIIVSSAPPVKYPDCYGIDMSKIWKFVAFQAALEIHTENGNEALLREIAKDCIEYSEQKKSSPINHVQKLYTPITHEQLEEKIAQIIRPKDCSWRGNIHVLYQTPLSLRTTMPRHTGDWFFTGDYPTPGGYAVVNKSFVLWAQGIEARAY